MFDNLTQKCSVTNRCFFSLYSELFVVFMLLERVSVLNGDIVITIYAIWDVDDLSVIEICFFFLLFFFFKCVALHFTTTNDNNNNKTYMSRMKRRRRRKMNKIRFTIGWLESIFKVRVTVEVENSIMKNGRRRSRKMRVYQIYIAQRNLTHYLWL